ncbi:MAG TPA: hypothetical protein VHL55_07945 [Acidimicrobiia bacterium]|jgi:hypothetical protein|nr:hypothetical protein [Acidimicrobiia bacterium]
MRFLKRYWQPIADGAVTIAFRRWQSPRVIAGRRYRTPAGIIEIDEIGTINESAITDDEARAAGHADAASLLADLPQLPGLLLYRVRFHVANVPDPRSILAESDQLTAEDVAQISARLDRLDRLSSHGPWTRQVLQTIAGHPGRRAPDLAAWFGRETKPFKTDVRKLKNLGLTLSLPVGYQLSPRGEAYVRQADGPAGSSK